MPEPPGLSCPDQLTGKLGELNAGSEATVLVGATVAPTSPTPPDPTERVKAGTPSAVGMFAVAKLPLAEANVRKAYVCPATGLKPPRSDTLRAPARVVVPVTLTRSDPVLPTLMVRVPVEVWV